MGLGNHLKTNDGLQVPETLASASPFKMGIYVLFTIIFVSYKRLFHNYWVDFAHLRLRRSRIVSRKKATSQFGDISIFSLSKLCVYVANLVIT